MEAIVERCCGLDVHQATVVACLLVGPADKKPRREVRTFGTTTPELVSLRDWLQAAGCTHVGMESTGVYWKPVYAVLEGSFELIVGNARHIKNVPGRKTDVKDSEWIADLVRHGLIRKSLVVAKPLRELRDLLRYRTKLVQARTAQRNRLLKLLETANVKLSSVMSDVFGLSGMAMLQELLNEHYDPETAAQHARGRMRRKIPALVPALQGRLEEHHRFMLRMQLELLGHLDRSIDKLDERVTARLAPYAAVHERLMQIPGVNNIVAAVLIAELGLDMSAFLSAFHLASWAGVCPGNNESAGKRKPGHARKGNPHLRTMLVQAATSAARVKGSYLKDKYHRLKARRGPKRAALAIAHKILIATYHMLSTGRDYADLGDAYLDRHAETRVRSNLVRRLERLGYNVTLERRAA
jgi:transposase